MAEFKQNLEESARRSLKQTPGISVQKQGLDQYSNYMIKRSLIKKDDWYNQFYSYIKKSVGEYANILFRDGLIDISLFCRFTDAFEQLKSYLKEAEKNEVKEEGDAYTHFYEDEIYFNYLDEMLYLSIWDADLADDPEGRLSPYGKLLIILRDYKGRRRIGILQAAEQHHCHIHKDNLKNAQKIATEIYNHFKVFAETNNLLENLSPGFQYQPIVQFCAGGAAALLSGLPVPSFIAMDKTKAHDFSSFSALPHESAHNIINAFEDLCLIKAIEEEIEKLSSIRPEFRNYWKKWAEECLADAIAVAIIKDAEIHSLANLFSNSPTNMILKDVTGKKMDGHPFPHIRVLLAIEVGRLLDLGDEFLDTTEKEWIQFSERINGNDHDKVINQCELDKNDEYVTYPMNDFVKELKKIAKVLVNTGIGQINGNTIGDIFRDFDSDLVKKELTPSILKTRKKWCELK